MADDVKPKTIEGVLKEQFALIGVLAVLIGTIYTDAYYTGFGLRYQSLSLPASHILYRGFTVLIGCPYVAIPYLLQVSWLAFLEMKGRSPWVSRHQIWMTYVMIVAILCLTYPLAVWAGQSTAAKDGSASGQLPRIKRLLPASNDSHGCEPDRCRLLLIDADYLYVFVPQKDPNDVPNVKRLSRKDFNEIDTGTQ